MPVTVVSRSAAPDLAYLVDLSMKIFIRIKAIAAHMAAGMFSSVTLTLPVLPVVYFFWHAQPTKQIERTV